MAVAPEAGGTGCRSGAGAEMAPRGRDPTIEARPQYRAAPEINNAGVRKCAEVASSGIGAGDFDKWCIGRQAQIRKNEGAGWIIMRASGRLPSGKVGPAGMVD